MQLNLSIPDTLEGQEFLIEHAPSVVKKQLFSEIEANPADEVKRVTKIVADINRCDLSLSEIEKLNKIFFMKYQAVLAPARDYRHQVYDDIENLEPLLNQLTLELTYCFKRQVLAYLAHQKWILNLQKKLANAVNASLYFLSLYKSELYQLRKPLSSNLWQEIHDLYSFAEQQSLLKHHSSKVSEPVLSMAPEISINYIRACLIAEIAPFSLDHRSSWNLFQYLYFAASLVEMVDLEAFDPSSNSRYLLIDLKRANKGQLNQSFEPKLDSLRLLLLDKCISDAKKQLENFWETGQLSSQSFFTSLDNSFAEPLFKSILDGFKGNSKRKEERYPVSMLVQTVWGAEHILNAFSEPTKVTNALDRQLKPKEWQSTDQSTGGLCIEERKFVDLDIAKTTPVIVRTLENPERPSKWRLAVSRWFESNGGINKVGLNYLGDRVSLVHLANQQQSPLLMIETSEHLLLFGEQGIFNGLNNFAIIKNNAKVLCQFEKAYQISDGSLAKVLLK